MATVSEIRRLTDHGRAVAAGDKTMNPNTAIELVKTFDLIDHALARLAGEAPPAHRGRRWGLWRRRGQ